MNAQTLRLPTLSGAKRVLAEYCQLSLYFPRRPPGPQNSSHKGFLFYTARGAASPRSRFAAPHSGTQIQHRCRCSVSEEMACQNWIYRRAYLSFYPPINLGKLQAVSLMYINNNARVQTSLTIVSCMSLQPALGPIGLTSMSCID